jgi:hypothetical protein
MRYVYVMRCAMVNRNRVYIGLLDAAYALDEQAAGRSPELSRLLSGAITLDTLFRRGALQPELEDAALDLGRAVIEGKYHLDAIGRTRAANLAVSMRLFAAAYAEDTNSDGGTMTPVY